MSVGLIKEGTQIYMLHAGFRMASNIKLQMFGFWLSIVDKKKSKLSKTTLHIIA